MTSETTRCPRRDDTAALAMGGLAPHEARELERHLAGCAACRRSYRRSLEVVTVLDEAARPGAGPRTPALAPGLEHATLARMLGGDPGDPGDPGGERTAGPVVRLRSRLPSFLAGAAAALLLVAGPLAVLLVRAEQSPPVLELAGTDAAPDAWGEATLVARTHGTLIDFEAGDLPTGPGSYVVTVRSDGAQVAREVFDVDADGWGTALMRTDLPASAPYEVVVSQADPGADEPPVLRAVRSS